MFISVRKKTTITAGIGICLALVAYPAMAQADSSAGKNIQVNSRKAAAGLLKTSLAPATPGIVWPPVINPYNRDNASFNSRNKNFNESRPSKTIISIIGMGALSILAEKTNHTRQYSAYNTHR